MAWRQKCPFIRIHIIILLLQDYFPAVADWLKYPTSVLESWRYSEVAGGEEAWERSVRETVAALMTSMEMTESDWP